MVHQSVCYVWSDVYVGKVVCKLSSVALQSVQPLVPGLQALLTGEEVGVSRLARQIGHHNEGVVHLMGSGEDRGRCLV